MHGLVAALGVLDLILVDLDAVAVLRLEVLEQRAVPGSEVDDVDVTDNVVDESCRFMPPCWPLWKMPTDEPMASSLMASPSSVVPF